MERREFMTGVAGAAGVLAAGGLAGTARAGATSRAEPFRSAFAPHFGMFGESGGDAVGQLEFAADQGFTAFEDNGMLGRSVEEQEKIARAMERLNMRMGIFVVNMGTAWGPSFCGTDKGLAGKFLDECRRSVECAKRVNATWMTVVPGAADPRLHREIQTAHCVELLRRGADIFEPHGLVMVIEALNPYRDHPGMLVSRVTQAYGICKGVNSPACKLIFDFYHQQITEGNLIPNFDACYDEIAYVQTGDTPGRCEPTTGEVNYRTIFRHLRERGYTGILGMEHGNSLPGAQGERAVIDAYRWCDAG